MNVFISKLTFIITIIALMLLILWLGIRLFFISFPFIIAYFLSKPLGKLAHFITDKTKIPIGITTFVVVLLFVSAFVTTISFAVYKIAISLSGFSGLLTTGIQSIQNFTSGVNAFTIELPWLDEPFAISDLFIQFYDVLLRTLSQVTNSIVDALLRVIKTIPVIGLFFFFMFISLYFFIKDQVRVTEFIKKGNALIKSPLIISIKSKTLSILKSYIKAQLILVTITFIISLIALSILKVPFAPLVAMGVAFIDLIPMIGPAFVYVPWIIYTLIISEYSTGIGLLITYLVTTLTRQTIEPKIVSENIGTHPLFTIISMYACYRIFGVSGFIIGAFLVMIVLIAIKVYHDIRQKDEH
ncbi:MAG TPA: hypothetical protein DCS67_07020 [Clostridiales bacterium UBA8960]|nr:hypothetical protein [Clostridiales bacterium UBA8960]